MQTAAEIPLLDWTGPVFLTFYLIALIVLVVWCRRNAGRALGRYDHSRDYQSAGDSYETAYLSAGEGRVVQLAVSRALHQGWLRWKPGLLGARLVADVEVVPGDAHAAERGLMERAIAAGGKGMPLRDAGRCVAPALRSIEVALATRGLRPTSEERSSAGLLSVVPLILLCILGIVKLLVGITRDRPVLFLLLLLGLTLILIIWIARSVPRLTSSGESLLAKLRARNEVERHGVSRQDEGGLELVSNSVALFGPSAVATVPVFAAIHGDIEKLHAKPAPGSGGGCSSGCGGGGCSSSGGGSDGGSGCGGGGCGGCGGGD